MISFDDLRLVNAKVNAFPYVPDTKRYDTPEFWAEMDADGGDCEDFAIGKLRMLLGRDWPISALRLATCWCENGEYHAVLLADLEDETWVLDNRHPHPTEYALLPYKWHKFQIAGTQKWELA